MQVDELRNAYRSEPFQPFTLRVAYGREYRVDHPEFMAISPTGRTVVVFDAEGVYDILDSIMITGIHFGNGKTRKRRAQ